jgi:hypothetical protein
VRTHYRFQAPDRMAYATDTGTRSVFIGETGWDRSSGGRWKRGSAGVDGFQLWRFFRWTAYDHAVRWLGPAQQGRSPAVELAVYDPATPVWFRLRIERDSGRVLSERMIATGHFMDRRYFAFNRHLRIVPPK